MRHLSDEACDAIVAKYWPRTPITATLRTMLREAADQASELITSTKPADGLAGADEVLPEMPRPAITYADHSYPAYSKKQMEEFARLSVATLAHQQAPVGDSVDTTALRFLLLIYRSAKSAGGIDTALNNIFAHITAWKDAQLARERQGRPTDLSKRLRNEAAEAKTSQNRFAGSLLAAADEIERLSGEPVARLADIREEDGEIHFEVKWIRPGQCQVGSMLYLGPAPQADECRLLCEKLDISIRSGVTPMSAIACHIADLKYEAKKAAAQADEVRDAARYRWFVKNWIQPNPLHRWQPRFGEKHASGGVMWRGVYTEAEFDAAIDAAMTIKRTTAADNQKG